MTRAGCYYFTLLLALIMIILLSKPTLAASGDWCDCDESTLCANDDYFCDYRDEYPTASSCNIDVFESLCIPCRTEGQTCKSIYGDEDCCQYSEPLNCTGIVAGTGRCCPNKYKWNTTTSSCQAPLMNPCEGNGSSTAGNNYCASLGTGKNLCCGTAGNGHCEECCNLAQCTNFCEYCNTTGSSGTWSCDEQRNMDLKDDCNNIYQVCDGSGGCTWIDATPSIGCEWPTEPVFVDGKIYDLVMCTYNCAGNCYPADPYTIYPYNQHFCKTESSDNPFWGFNTHGCTWCISDAVPDCVDICVVTEGEGCEDYRSIDHPQGCCDHDDECSNNHCCPAGRAWNGTECGPCHSYSTSGNWVCANEHIGGSASCACGGPCYTYSVSGVDYVHNCAPTERCITYHPDPMVDPDMPTALKICSACKTAADCCQQGMVATTDAQCKACNADWYLNGTHCCPQGWSWDPLFLTCSEHDPCYSASRATFCNFFAPNIIPGSLAQSSWWNPLLPMCLNLTINYACCFVNSGMYGFINPGDEYYYWHEQEIITTY